MLIHEALNRAAEWRRRSRFTESARVRHIFRQWARDALRTARITREMTQNATCVTQIK